MIALDYDERYRSVNDVIKDLTRGTITEPSKESLAHTEHCGDGCIESAVEKHLNTEEIRPRIGGGFSDVAGMESVKRMLYKDVMFVMQNKEKAAKYRLKAPNGALFYGPPGCGKTFIAEKFAEESHLNFMMVKASDLGSIYIHGTQGKIAELFEEAAKKAPTVICFDELDGMVPDRSTIHNEGASGEVNEFLSQLNNCSERGIFVIGTSNRPEKIDPAILRTGRMDKMVYIPMPDVEARKELFKIHLADRYCDESLDLDELAKQSDGYVASDISYMVNASALEAAMADVPISQELVLAEMRKARRSVTQDDAADYERMRKKFEQQTPRQERRRIGF
jgi:transitional endoplasmic reticulum ATPase